MDKIVGNSNGYGWLFYRLYVCALALLFVQGMHALSLTLRVLDSNRKERSQVIVGQPFVIEVVAQGARSVAQAPVVMGLDTMHGRRTGVRMTSIDDSRCYSYSARIDQEGTYTIGPAVIEYRGKRISSQELTITAHAPDSEDAPREESNAFLRFITDETEVVTGQAIHVALRFYYNDPAITLKQIRPPEMSDFMVSPVQGPYGGHETIDDTEYDYAEWRYTLFSLKPGSYMIPAASADFLQPKNNSVSHFFMPFFSMNVEEKRVYSNTTHCKVIPLPAYHEEVKAIGRFKQLSMQVKPSEAREGEGIELTIELEGEGNFEMIEEFPLRNIPPALKYYYDAKRYVVKPTDADQRTQKRFGFIMQGLHAGDWEIPAQEFTFYDIDQKKYRTLKTVPQKISISARPTNITHDHASSLPSQSTPMVPAITQLPINSDGPWYPVTERQALHWLFFLLLLIIPLVPLGWIVLRKVRHWMDNRYAVLLRRRYAFKGARKNLNDARRAQNVAAIYPIFVHLIAVRMNSTSQAVTEKYIETLWQERQLSEKMIQEWKTFWITVRSYTYGSRNESDNRIFNQAEQWIDQLEKRI
jgi:hypothetical protein